MFLLPLAMANDWVEIPKGEFRLGCDQHEDDRCRPDESPVTPTLLDTFQIQKTEVTQDEWAHCVGSGLCTEPAALYAPASRGSWPVTGISRDEAENYCGTLGGTLPTEAQWEKAARGTDGRLLPWGDAAPTCDVARLAGCGMAIGPVGQFPGGASPYGVLDMIGNAWEYVAANYAPYGAADTGNTDYLLVIRGPNLFSWNRLVATTRSVAPLTMRSQLLGFRCARSQP